MEDFIYETKYSFHGKFCGQVNVLFSLVSVLIISPEPDPLESGVGSVWISKASDQNLH